MGPQAPRGPTLLQPSILRGRRPPRHPTAPWTRSTPRRLELFVYSEDERPAPSTPVGPDHRPAGHGSVESRSSSVSDSLGARTWMTPAAPRSAHGCADPLASDAHDRQGGSDDLAVSPVIPLVRLEEDVRSDGVRRHAENHQKDRPQEVLLRSRVKLSRVSHCHSLIAKCGANDFPWKALYPATFPHGIFLLLAAEAPLAVPIPYHLATITSFPFLISRV